jgi:NAD(P)-dependent dehydrogenase (short-subunit alcohol dehydrogenase family)
MNNNQQDQYTNPFNATISGIRNLFRKQEKAGELTPEDRLDGKTVLVDGASSGLGFAIAVDVARRGARVIMACRSGIPEKGEKAKKLSGSGNIHMVHVDYTDINSIRDLASTLLKEYAPIDIFVCNAGVVTSKSRKTPQGLEQMFMVNYFSKFIFVNLLIETGCFSGNGNRVIFVSSETHRAPAGFDWPSFGIYQDHSIGKAIELYGYYKMLLTTFAVELSRRMNSEGRTFPVFALCPGPVNSNIGREAPKIFHPLMKLVFAIFFKSPAKAAIPVIYLATSHDLDRKAFDYMFLMSRKDVGKNAADPENGRMLWERSMELRRQLMKDQL